MNYMNMSNVNHTVVLQKNSLILRQEKIIIFTLGDLLHGL